MKKVVIDGFELNDDYIERLINDLKEEGVKTRDDLQRYLKDHWYTEDTANKNHLLMSRHGKKRNFALPFDE